MSPYLYRRVIREKFAHLRQVARGARATCAARICLSPRTRTGARSPYPQPGGGDALMTRVGPIGRLGRYTATHFRVVLIAWLLVVVVLGFFAARVENALSGAGWEKSGSQSVQARQLVDRNFHGLSSYRLMAVISSPTKAVDDPSFQSAVARVERALRGDRAVSTVVPPTAGVS